MGWPLILLASFFGIATIASVPVLDTVRFLLAVLLLQVIPGISLSRALLGRPGDVAFHASIGIPIGIACSLLLFLGLAPWNALNMYLPAHAALAVFLTIGCAIAIARTKVAAQQAISAWKWYGTALAIAAMALLAMTNFPFHPLPADIPAAGASYYFDLPWHMGIAGLLKTQWPPANPGGIGQLIVYHMGSHIFGAALDLTAGVDIPTQFLRLLPLFLCGVLALQILSLGNMVGTSNTGPIALAVFFFFGCAQILVGRFSPEHFSNYAFMNLVFSHLYVSQSQHLGQVFLAGLLMLAVAADKSEPRRLPLFCVTALLCAGAALAKGTIVPVFATATGAVVLLHWARTRRLASTFLLLFVTAVAVQAALSVLTIPNPSSGLGLGFKFAAIFWFIPAFESLRASLAGYPAVYVAVAGGILFFAYAPAMLLGLAAGFIRQPSAFISSHALFLLVGGAGLAAALLLDHRGSGQLYFLTAGYVALCVPAATGLERLWYAGTLARGATIVVCAIALLSRLQEALPGVLRVANITQDRERRLNPELVTALDWIRNNTPPNAIFAVNRQTIDRGGGRLQYRNNDYAGLAERQALVGGYDYMIREWRDGVLQIPRYKGHELGDLARLQDRVFLQADREALERLHEITGVRLILIDRRAPHDPQIRERWRSWVVLENDSAILLLLPNQLAQ